MVRLDCGCCRIDAEASVLAVSIGSCRTIYCESETDLMCAKDRAMNEMLSYGKTHGGGLLLRYCYRLCR